MYLPYITDDSLIEEVEKVVEVIKEAKSSAEAKLHSNVLDPFGALFHATTQGLLYDQWIQLEMGRQIQKTMQNAIGKFHQGILGNIEGWEDLGTGGVVDIKNENKKIIAEIKNKHNTVTGIHLIGIYDSIESQLNLPNYSGFTGYFVQIIPKRKQQYDKLFTPSDHALSNAPS